MSREVEGWRALASVIPDEALRARRARSARVQARRTLTARRCSGRCHAHARRELLRLLVAYEILADYLDCTSERAANDGIRNGLQLHRALIEAIDPSLALSDYYQYHPWREDGGYVRALVERCRQALRRLPSFAQAQPLAARAARLTPVLALNHEPEPDAARRPKSERGQHCTFRTTASSPGLSGPPARAPGSRSSPYLPSPPTPAATQLRRRGDICRLPAVGSLAGTMLDSYADIAEDAAGAAHSYIAHYASATEALDAHRRDPHRRPREGRRPAKRRAPSRTHQLHGRDVPVKGQRAHHRERAATRQLAQPPARSRSPDTRASRLANGVWPADRRRRRRSPRQCGLPWVLHSSSARLPPSAPLPYPSRRSLFWRDPLRYLGWCRRRYGSRFTIRTRRAPAACVHVRPDDITAIVRAPADVLHPGAGAAVIAPLVGEGSFMLAEEEKHLEGRRAILPAFQHSRVREHAEMVRDIVTRRGRSWPRDRPVAIHPYLRALSLRVILRTIFGQEAARQGELHARLLRMLTMTASLTLQERQLDRSPRGEASGRVPRRARGRPPLIDELISEEAHAPRSRERTPGDAARRLPASESRDVEPQADT